MCVPYPLFVREHLVDSAVVRVFSREAEVQLLAAIGWLDRELEMHRKRDNGSIPFIGGWRAKQNCLAPLVFRRADLWASRDGQARQAGVSWRACGNACAQRRSGTYHVGDALVQNLAAFVDGADGVVDVEGAGSGVLDARGDDEGEGGPEEEGAGGGVGGVGGDGDGAGDEGDLYGEGGADAVYDVADGQHGRGRAERVVVLGGR